MTVFDAMMCLNMVFVVGRQVAIAHAHISTFAFGMAVNVCFFIAYASQELWAGVAFSTVHTILTLYGWERWYNDRNKNNT